MFYLKYLYFHCKIIVVFSGNTSLSKNALLKTIQFVYIMFEIFFHRFNNQKTFFQIEMSQLGKILISEKKCGKCWEFLDRIFVNLMCYRQIGNKFNDVFSVSIDHLGNPYVMFEIVPYA